MSWLKDFAALVQRVLTYGVALEQNTAEVKEIRRELRDLTIIVHALAQDIKNSKEQHQHRHEKLLLEVENRLLKYERALPPARARKKSAQKGSTQ